ncbi:MAG TPA: hypothetical protein VKS21_00670, partial [Spirochaetota bacterium]|nr:hypothetical protein [Spirochaetota bacterium]
MIKKVNYLLILIVIINITSGWADMVSNRSSHNTYTTITAALSAAAANDNLDIYKGIYSETVNLTAINGIRLRSVPFIMSNDQNSVVLDLTDNDYGINISKDNILIQGITVSNSPFIAVYITGGEHITLANNVFTCCQSWATIYDISAASADLQYLSNRFENCDDGIVINSAAHDDIIFSHNIFRNITDCPLQLNGETHLVIHNVFDSMAHAVQLESGSCNIYNNLFLDINETVIAAGAGFNSGELRFNCFYNTGSIFSGSGLVSGDNSENSAPWADYPDYLPLTYTSPLVDQGTNYPFFSHPADNMTVDIGIAEYIHPGVNNPVIKETNVSAQTYISGSIAVAGYAFNQLAGYDPLTITYSLNESAPVTLTDQPLFSFLLDSGSYTDQSELRWVFTAADSSGTSNHYLFTNYTDNSAGFARITNITNYQYAYGIMSVAGSNRDQHSGVRTAALLIRDSNNEIISSNQAQTGLNSFT